MSKITVGIFRKCVADKVASDTSNHSGGIASGAALTGLGVGTGVPLMFYKPGQAARTALDNLSEAILAKGYPKEFAERKANLERRWDIFADARRSNFGAAPSVPSPEESKRLKAVVDQYNRRLHHFNYLRKIQDHAESVYSPVSDLYFDTLISKKDPSRYFKKYGKKLGEVGIKTVEDLKKVPSVMWSLESKLNRLDSLIGPSELAVMHDVAESANNKLRLAKVMPSWYDGSEQAVNRLYDEFITAATEHARARDAVKANTWLGKVAKVPEAMSKIMYRPSRFVKYSLPLSLATAGLGLVGYNGYRAYKDNTPWYTKVMDSDIFK